MESYQRYLNPVMGSAAAKTVPKSSACGGGSITIPAVSALPSPYEVREYVPFSSTSWQTPYSRESFSQVVKSGRIKMTDYQRGESTVTDYIVGVPSGNSRSRAMTVYSGGNCCYKGSPVLEAVKDRWTEQGDFLLWSSVYSVHDVGDPSDDVDLAIAATRERSVAESLSGFDLLTEMAESRETLAYLKSTNESLRDILSKVFDDTPNDTVRRAKKLTPKRLLKSADWRLRRIGARWLEYRYALMPLLYTYEEIRELASEDGSLWKTFRSSREVPLPGSEEPGADGIYASQSGSITVRSTVKVGFTSKNASIAQGINFNPLLTAYNLVPLSFVLNWIVNVEETILAKYAQSFGVEYAACTSVRVNTRTEYRLVVRQPINFERIVVGNPCISAGTYTFDVLTRDVDGVLRVTTQNTYARSAFGRADVSLRLRKENLSWKRWIDAFVLSFNRVGRLWR